MKHFNLDGFFLVVTENKEEKERFQNSLTTFKDPVAPQPAPNQNVAPLPDPASPNSGSAIPTLPEPPPPLPPPPPDPVGTPLVVTSLTPSSVIVSVGSTNNFVVRINAARTTPTVVTLVASAPAVLQVQASVTIPAGSLSAIFTTRALAAGSSTLTATANGTSKVSTMTVNPLVTGGEIFSPLPVNGLAIPTFHNMSLYLNLSAPPPSSTTIFPGPKVWVRFRRANESAFKQAFPLWYDERTTGNMLPYAYNCRGSVVNLQPGTKYVFEFARTTAYPTQESQWEFHCVGTTWSEAFVEKDTTVLSSGGQYTVDTGGSLAEGYKVYDGQGTATRTGLETATGNVDNGNNSTSGTIIVRASYVILRRLTVRKGGYSSIYIAPNVTDVVIEDCDLADWAWQERDVRGGGWAHNKSSGVLLSENNSRIIIQRNKMHHPHRGTWSWDVAHPEGPEGIFIRHGGSQNVIRYNEIYADILGTGQPGVNNPWWNDAIGGEQNFSDRGCPGADSDIYGNILLNACDDAIEAEGGGRNVRVYNNYTDHTTVGIATTVAHFGPVYVFRNVINRLRYRYNVEPDLDARPVAFKNYGAVNGYGNGRKYHLHNTLLQTPGDQFNPVQDFPLGPGDGNDGGENTGQGMANSISRNNIYHVRRTNYWSVLTGGSSVGGNHFAFDMYNGRLENPPRENMIAGTPTYVAGHGWSSIPALGGGGTGNYQLASGTGLDAGTSLPNFNDVSSHQPAQGAAPDVGAHEAGTAAMKFGIIP